jgi:hypothetical protein
MFLHSSEDMLYIFGGYSKQKEGSKQEGKVLVHNGCDISGFLHNFDFTDS